MLYIFFQKFLTTFKIMWCFKNYFKKYLLIDLFFNSII